MPGIVEAVLDLGKVVVEALRHQGPDQDQALSSRRHVVRSESEPGHPVQQRESTVGQQDPIAVGELPQRLPPRDQLVDPAGEALFDIDECGGELVGIGIEYGPDLGQRYACAGQGPDLNQPQQFGGSVASVAGAVAAGFVVALRSVANLHLLINNQTATRTSRAINHWISASMRAQDATLERLRVERKREEALAHGPDPLHLAEVFGLDVKTAMRYADSARALLQQTVEHSASPSGKELGPD